MKATSFAGRIIPEPSKLLPTRALRHFTLYGLHWVRCLNTEPLHTQGPILTALLEKVQLTGGILTASDFAAYEPIVMPALKGSYKNRTVYTSHAPTSGPVLLHMLNLLESFNDEDDTNEGLRLHRFVETLKCEWASSYLDVFGGTERRSSSWLRGKVRLGL